MLHQGHSLKAVADVLGHRHLGTTFIYTKVDFNALKQVGLAFPGGALMPSVTLHSWLSGQIGRFIELRRLLGTDYQSQAKLLGYFDRFLLQGHLSPVDPLPVRSSNSIYKVFRTCITRVQYNRFCVVRQLCEYIAQSDPSCYVPEPMKCGSAQKAHRPYIVSKSEIEALLSTAWALPPPKSLRPHTYHTLLGLLYTTGIRIGEAFEVALKDFHREQNLLYIAKGKFRKARWVPLHPSTSQVLEQYVSQKSPKRSKVTRLPPVH